MARIENMSADTAPEIVVSIGNTATIIRAESARTGSGDIKLSPPTRPGHLLTGFLEAKNQSAQPPETVEQVVDRMNQIPQMHAGGSNPDDEEIELIQLADGSYVLPTDPRAAPATPDGTGPGGVDGGRRDGGGGGEGREPTPEPFPSIDRLSIERAANPEIGRFLAEEIGYWEGLRANGKYEKVNWKRLDELYDLQEAYTVGLRKVSHEVDIKSSEPPKPKQIEQLTAVDVNNLRNPDTGAALTPLANLIQQFERRNIPDLDLFNKEIAIYFKEAERIGLLRDLKETLSSAYHNEVRRGIHRELKSGEVMSGSRGEVGVDAKIQQSIATAADIYDEAFIWRIDPNIQQLAGGDIDVRTGRVKGVWDLYAQFARQRFVNAINSKDAEGITQREYLIRDQHNVIQEFELREDVEGKYTTTENFWRPSYGIYVEVYAQTEEEFLIAADTWLTARETIKKDPARLTQEANNFTDILMNSEGAKKVSPDFMKRLVWGVEARLGVFGADHSNELYEPEAYKQFMDFINKDGSGPERWLELFKLYDAKIAATLGELDFNPTWDILFTFHGSRGQLAKDFNAQRNIGYDQTTPQGLYNQTLGLLIDRVMGIEIKDKNNVSQVTRFMNKKKFVSMFDGLYEYDKLEAGRQHGDAHIHAYEANNRKSYKDYTPQELKDLTAGQRQSIRLGEIQFKIQEMRKRLRNGDIQLDLGESIVKKLEHDKQITPADARFYEEKRKEAAKIVEIAMQAYGALGEKSKRGGGIFKVHRRVEGKKFTDFVPIYQSEKLATCAGLLTKMEYADDSPIWLQESFQRKIRTEKNFKAKYRTARVKQAEKDAIEEFYKDGYQAKLYKHRYDAEGRRIPNSRTAMMLRRPKEDPNTGEVIIENDEAVVEEVQVTFHIAGHHPYGDVNPHTYWGYQDEHRSMLLNPFTFAQAREIRAGRLRWEDADPAAIALLQLDPTLLRVRQFPREFTEREGKLVMAAVEDSYQSRKRVQRELYKKFFPPLASPTSPTDKTVQEINVYYGLQDFGGFRKMCEHVRARVAENPERFTRRGRRLIPYLDIPLLPVSDMWGLGVFGATGVFWAMGNGVHKIGGTFALGKVSAQAEIANLLYISLIGDREKEGGPLEGLLLKLTNESDTNLQEFFGKIPDENSKWQPDQQQDFCVAFRKSLGRLEKYLKLLVTMESIIRNAQGALSIEEMDVIDESGGTGVLRFNHDLTRRLDRLPKITRKAAKDITVEELKSYLKDAYEILESTQDPWNAKFDTGDPVDYLKNPGIDETRSPDTGSGRHSARIFNNAFFDLLLDLSKRGGVELYRNERFFYAQASKYITYYDPEIAADLTPDSEGNVRMSSQNIKDWFFGKAVPT